MANRGQNTIIGNPGRIQYQAIYGTDTQVGTTQTSKVLADGQRIVGVNLIYGEVPLNNYVGSVKDVAPPVPSGYNFDGTVNYGQGATHISTTWKLDTSHVKGSGNFVIFQPLAPVEYFFSKLST